MRLLRTLVHRSTALFAVLLLAVLAAFSGNASSASSGGDAPAQPIADLQYGNGKTGYEIYFVRHAHSTYPAPEQELSELGIEEAGELVTLLHDEDIRSVDTSMMLRSFQTGDGVAADHDVPVLADERINEIVLVPDGVPSEEAYVAILRDWLEDRNREVAYGAENYYDAEERWMQWWNEYLREHRNDRGSGVVVAHGLIYTVMLPQTCDNPISADFALGNPHANTGYVKATLMPNGDLLCTEWNGVPVPGVQ